MSQSRISRILVEERGKVRERRWESGVKERGRKRVLQEE